LTNLVPDVTGHQTATKRSNFWHSDLGDNYESAYDIFHLTCAMLIPGETFQKSYILQINKTEKRQIKKILSINLTD